MKRVLIANRGEIAVRVARACRAYGVAPVMVYSEADRDAPHVVMGDGAFCLGAGPADESYLNPARVLEAAARCGADAIHPGYGFLSENADFADAVTYAGLRFIGPPADVIRHLGDKAAAKRIAAAAGVPVVPGYSGDDQTWETFQNEATRIGTPLLIKAAAGGGGRGMRRVDDLSDFPDRCVEARAEAKNAFGNERLLLERYIEQPRHVEIQIFGDTQGNIVHLFERDCSIQRRHQKIVEESPSPVLTSELRARMTDAALAVGQAAGYVGAGTVEFLVEARANKEPTFFFLEVNTRLQVEHAVTEMITDIDLVRWQLLVADGDPLPLSQTQITPHGHAVEARIYAEDPSAAFMPSVGTIDLWRDPAGPGIRVDAGYASGSAVPPFYDPMLAKVIAHASTRAEALARLDAALGEFTVLGVRTNIAYLREILTHPTFRSGQATTGFLAENFADWRPPLAPPPEVLLALAASTILPHWAALGRGDCVSAATTIRSANPWTRDDDWRNA